MAVVGQVVPEGQQTKETFHALRRSTDGILYYTKIDKDNQVFHAGTYIKDKKILSNGGRVLNITSSAKELIDARKKILTNLDKIKWDDGFYRKDIGWRAIKNENN